MLAFLTVVVGALVLVPTAAAVDTTPPIVTLNLSGTPGANGWFVSPVTASWSYSDPESTITSTSGCNVVTLNSDTTGVTISCSATSEGGTVTITRALKLDQTPPSIDGAVPSRSPDRNGWYNHSVDVEFSGSDATSGIGACAVGSYGGPDSANALVSGTCTDLAGNESAPGSFTLKYDSSPPTVTGAKPDRQPNAAGWYRRPVSVAFAGADSLSGLGACTSTTYGGPDDGSATVRGSCVDLAGNMSAEDAFPLRYDSTPPAPPKVTVLSGDRTITLRWKLVDDARVVEVLRSRKAAARKVRVFRGTAKKFKDADRRLRNGTRYHYVVRVFDAAGNVRTTTLRAAPDTMLAPARNARVRKPPRLLWTPRKGADFYNLQLFRGKEKILSVWPKRNRYRLRSSWVWGGKRHRLSPGRYTWYVWPIARSTAGKRVGKSTFVRER